MFFYNVSNNVVLLCIKDQEIVLKPNEKIEVLVDKQTEITLKHLYGSNSMSLHEIAKDDADVSIVSAMLSSYKPPYFQIVLDSTFFIQGSPETLVQIEQHYLRPCYPCSYDCFDITITNGTAIRQGYNFVEKEEFTNIYKRATTAGTKKILFIIFSVLLLFSIPVILGLCYVNSIFAIISLITLIIVCCLIYLVSYLVSKFSNYVNYKVVLENFESDVIEKHFKENETQRD